MQRTNVTPLHCIVIGYNEVPFPRYESFLLKYGADTEAYRDLQYSFVHRGAGLSFRLAEQTVYGDQFHLKLFGHADGDALRLEFQYDPRRFAPPMIERLSQQFLTALADVCAQLPARLGRRT